MNALFRLEVTLLRRLGPMAVFWLLLGGAGIWLIVLAPGGLRVRGWKEEERLTVLTILSFALMLVQSAVTVWVSRQTEPLALTVPLSRWRRVGAGVLLMMSVAAVSALVFAPATFALVAGKRGDLTLHFLNFFLICLGASLAYGTFFPVAAGLSWFGRTALLSSISCFVLAGAFAQGMRPGIPWLWGFLLGVNTLLVLAYHQVQRKIEILPGGSSAAGDREVAPAKLPSLGQQRVEGKPLDAEAAGRPRGHPPWWTLLTAGWRKPLVLIVLLLALIVALAASMAAVMPVLLGVFVMSFIALGMQLVDASLTAWAPFIPSPYSRKKAFAAILLPPIMFLGFWTASRIVCIPFWSHNWIHSAFGIDEAIQPGGAMRALLLVHHASDALVLFFLFSLLLATRLPGRTKPMLHLAVAMPLLLLPYGAVLWDFISQGILFRFLRQPAMLGLLAAVSLGLVWRNYHAFRRMTMLPPTAPPRPGPVYSPSS